MHAHGGRFLHPRRHRLPQGAERQRPDDVLPRRGGRQAAGRPVHRRHQDRGVIIIQRTPAHPTAAAHKTNAVPTGIMSELLLYMLQRFDKINLYQLN